MRRRGKYAALFVVAVVVAVAAAIVSRASSAHVSGPSGKVVFWEFNSDAPSLAAWKATIKAFEKKYPAIKVDMQIVPWSEQSQKLATAIATRSEPDVSMMGNDVVAQYAFAGKLTPLDSYIAQWSKAEGANVTNDYWPGDKLYYRLKGHYYGSPVVEETRMLLYNKQILAQAGVSPSSLTTWNSVLAAAQKIKAANISGVTPWLLPESKDYPTVQTFMTLYLSYGAHMLDSKGACGFDTPQFKSALKFYTDVYKNGLTNADETNVSGSTNDTAFIAGKGGLYISGPWMFALAKGQPIAKNMGVVPIPAGPKGRFGFLGGWPLVLWKDSKNAAAAATWIHFATSPKGGLGTIVKVSGLLPGRKSLVKKAPWNTFPLSAFSKQMNYAYPYQYPAPEIPQMGALETETIQDAVQRVATGSQSVDQSTTQLCSDINKALGK
jgi:ABC-type glycerol-3-phosphate transport system substrate-binding protein